MENGNEIPATTTATTATTTSAETTTVTTVAADAESDSEAETTADTEETVTRAASDADSSDETTTTTVSGATEEESSDTSVNHHDYCTVCKRKHYHKGFHNRRKKDKDNKEDSINYTPSKKAYEAIFNDAKTDVPFIVEDDEAYYLIVRFDITKRMTDDDLWTEDQMKAVASRKYWDNFTDDKKEMANALTSTSRVIGQSRSMTRSS